VHTHESSLPCAQGPQSPKPLSQSPTGKILQRTLPHGSSTEFASLREALPEIRDDTPSTQQHGSTPDATTKTHPSGNNSDKSTSLKHKLKAFLSGPKATIPLHFESRCERRGFGNRHIQRYLCGCQEWPGTEIEKMLQNRTGEGFIYILCGPRGSGKTQLAVNLACDELMFMLYEWTSYGEKKWPLYRKIKEIFLDIRSAFGNESTTSEAELVA
jgi:hypothetical protein